MSNIHRVSRLSLDESVSWVGAKRLGEHNEVDSTTGPATVSVDGVSGECQYRIVYKKAVRQSVLTDPARQVRLFQQMNPGKFCALYQDGWVAEYVEGRQATDDEIAAALLALYQEHRRILWDAQVEENVLVDDDNGINIVDVDYAVRRDSVASEAVVFGSADKLDRHIKKTSDLFSLHKVLAQAKNEGENWRPRSLGIILGLLYLEKCLNAEEILDDYISKNIIMAVRLAYELKMQVSVNLLKVFLYLDRLGRLAELLQSSNQLRQLLHQDQVGCENGLVPDKAFFGCVQTVCAKKQKLVSDDRLLRPAGLVLGLDCADIAEKLNDSRQVAKLAALTDHVDAVKTNAAELTVTPELKKALNIDRSAGSRAGRVIGMILTNAALVLLCLVGAGAAVFCWQRKRTGHSCWLFTETKTLEKLRIAQTAITRAAQRMI